MNRDEAKALWQQVRENHKKLASCKLHDFSIDLTPGKPWGNRYQCVNCGGEVDDTRKEWYEKGLKHAWSKEV